ncbi:hypothetical protein KY284_027187 [Solanum tuberosum]|nr:hypothetical protein KY284_027187 [Solanum tuberosum]
MEPFQGTQEIDKYKRMLGLQNVVGVVGGTRGDIDKPHYAMASGGDFNVIRNAEEKEGGLEFSPNEAFDFEHSINRCALT